MIDQPIRAIYKQGALHLLQPVDLPEGREVSLLILSQQNPVLAALSDLLVAQGIRSTPVPDSERRLRELAALYAGKPSLSDAIIEERSENE